MNVHDGVTKALRTWDWETRNVVPERLPLLDLFRQRFRGRLEGWSVLFIQHHLGSTIPMVAAFVESGARVDRLWHVDVPYSTDVEVNAILTTSLGTLERSLPLFNDPLVDYSTAQMLRTAQVLRDIASTGPEKLLVVDDGAYFLRTLLMLSAIGDSAVSRLNGACVVEQTTRGHRFLQSHRDDLVKHGIRAVSVARARTKLEFEAPFVGGAVAAALISARGTKAWETVLTLGFGAVGRACVEELRRRLPNSRITVVDPQLDPNAAAPARVSLRQEMPRSDTFDLILGCTGTNSFTMRDVSLAIDGAVLASASSADIEFGRASFVEAADRFDDDEVKVVDREGVLARGLHAPVAIQVSASKVLVFLNAGFPVNFDGQSEGLSVTMIQPTRCLLFAGAIQASRLKKPALQGLEPDTDGWILREAMATLPE